MTNLLFIDDGYTHDACIAEVPGIHGTLLFAYRPMTHEERDHVAIALQRDHAGKSGTEILAQAMAKHLTTWNLPIEISAKNVKRLVPPLFDKLYSTIAGSRPSDPLPETGEQPEAYHEGRDQKNS